MANTNVGISTKANNATKTDAYTLDIEDKNLTEATVDELQKTNAIIEDEKNGIDPDKITEIKIGEVTYKNYAEFEATLNKLVKGQNPPAANPGNRRSNGLVLGLSGEASKGFSDPLAMSGRGGSFYAGWQIIFGDKQYALVPTLKLGFSNGTLAANNFQTKGGETIPSDRVGFNPGVELGIDVDLRKELVTSDKGTLDLVLRLRGSRLGAETDPDVKQMDTDNDAVTTTPGKLFPDNRIENSKNQGGLRQTDVTQTSYGACAGARYGNHWAGASALLCVDHRDLTASRGGNYDHWSAGVVGNVEFSYGDRGRTGGTPTQLTDLTAKEFPKEIGAGTTEVASKINIPANMKGKLVVKLIAVTTGKDGKESLADVALSEPKAAIGVDAGASGQEISLTVKPKAGFTEGKYRFQFTVFDAEEKVLAQSKDNNFERTVAAKKVTPPASTPKPLLSLSRARPRQRVGNSGLFLTKEAQDLTTTEGKDLKVGIAEATTASEIRIKYTDGTYFTMPIPAPTGGSVSTTRDIVIPAAKLGGKAGETKTALIYTGITDKDGSEIVYSVTYKISPSYQATISDFVTKADKKNLRITFKVKEDGRPTKGSYSSYQVNVYPKGEQVAKFTNVYGRDVNNAVIEIPLADLSAKGLTGDITVEVIPVNNANDKKAVGDKKSDGMTMPAARASGGGTRARNSGGW